MRRNVLRSSGSPRQQPGTKHQAPNTRHQAPSIVRNSAQGPQSAKGDTAVLMTALQRQTGPHPPIPGRALPLLSHVTGSFIFKWTPPTNTNWPRLVKKTFHMQQILASIKPTEGFHAHF
ncbi:hypothetical protein E2C01_090846 [Portunus trituberculatus]|uniref:Uncharacterized protein n=1 Tax=Portunus trituberculatus TaxID=210409 RepID=A0A5B7JRA9_PORTR|nr:hypothetical protein [Portunus trituberculatus]